MPGLGDEFRAAREAHHLSLTDVSDQIHIRSMYLQSIEDGDPSFAAPVYVRGFIRTYARFLGLDPEAAVANFKSSLGETAQRAHEPIAVASLRSRRRPSPWLWIAGVAAVILVAFVSFKYVEFLKSGGSPRAAIGNIASPVPAASAVAFAATSKPFAKPIAKPTLEVHVTQDSWLSVKIDGASRFEGVAKAGTAKTFLGKNAQIRAGNAGGVDLTVDGKKLGKMGNVGDVVERTLTLGE